MSFCLFLLLFTQITISNLQEITEECVELGSDWRVNCSSSSTPDEDFIAWHINGMFVMEYKGMVTLELESVDQSDSGVYTCYNLDDLSFVYSTNTLTVFQPIKFLSPTNYEVSIEQDFDLFCEASGEPELTYSWFRNGSPIGTNSMSISIQNASISITGEYQCLVANECEQREFTIIVSFPQQISLSGAVIIGIVVVVIIVSFLAIVCIFISMVQLRKYVRHISSGSKSGSRQGTNISLRRKKHFENTSSHRDSISEMFIQDGAIHENPVFIEGSANEKTAFIGNLIGIPQKKTEEQKPQLSLADTAAVEKHYSSDDLDIKAKVKPELTPEVKRSKSLKQTVTEPSPPKLAPYEHRFSPHPIDQTSSKELSKMKQEREISEVVARKHKIFQPGAVVSPPKLSPPPPKRDENRTVLKRKISLEDELRVTPGDISDFLTNEIPENESDSDEELIAPLPIRRPHFGAKREVQKESALLREFQMHNPELSWDELDKHFHVLDTFVVPGVKRRAKLSTTSTTRPAPNLESIAEESHSTDALSDEVSKVAVKTAPKLVFKVTDIDEVDPWVERDISNIPRRIVATRTKRFDSKSLN